MRKVNLLFSIAVLFFALSSCTKDTCKSRITYLKYEPIYKTPEEIRVPVVFQGVQALERPGKIYLFRNYILINEQLKGIHVFDNADPQNPINIGFIKIEGNVDMATKGNILYADSYIDLLAIDITDVLNPVLVDREEGVFPSYGEDENGAICVAFEEKEVTEDLACSEAPVSGWGNPWVMEDQAFTTTSSAGSVPTAGRSDANMGTGGSMARFTINENHLYTVDNSNLHVFDISNLSNPVNQGQQNIGWANIETIFPYDNHLFIGSNAGMFIYGLSNPNQPEQLSFFQHAQACDPVFVDGNRAYVTLRGGTRCENFTNQLDVIDISNLQNPTLITSHGMENPHGLSIKNQVLYLCDGNFGFKVFDASNDFGIASSMLYSDNSIKTYDVIADPVDDIIIVVGDGGFYQFDSSDPSNIQKISEILVQ